jgi:C-terminal processing protease CtpA/Prc
MVEPRRIEDELGYLKVAMFPGMAGVEVARTKSPARLRKIGDVDCLIIDLLGNTGGGIGALRVKNGCTRSGTTTPILRSCR